MPPHFDATSDGADGSPPNEQLLKTTVSRQRAYAMLAAAEPDPDRHVGQPAPRCRTLAPAGRISVPAGRGLSPPGRRARASTSKPCGGSSLTAPRNAESHIGARCPGASVWRCTSPGSAFVSVNPHRPTANALHVPAKRIHVPAKRVHVPAKRVHVTVVPAHLTACSTPLRDDAYTWQGCPLPSNANTLHVTEKRVHAPAVSVH